MADAPDPLMFDMFMTARHAVAFGRWCAERSVLPVDVEAEWTAFNRANLPAGFLQFGGKGVVTGAPSEVTAESAGASYESFASAVRSLAIEGGTAGAEGLQGFLDLIVKERFLFWLQFVEGATYTTAPTIFQPVDWYLEWVAARADRTGEQILWRHGWPILSVGFDSPTVTDDRGAGNGSPAEAA
jgi:hypothetical protein